MVYKYVSGNQTYVFGDLKELMAKASPFRSGDQLAGIAATSEKERIIAGIVLAEVPLKIFLEEHLISYKEDEVTRLIIDEHNPSAFEKISHLTVGDLRDWLLGASVTCETLKSVSSGITPEMAAAVSKIMSIQDMILIASKCEVVTQFRNTLGLKGHFSTRLQPNHPFDSLKGIAASTLDGLLKGSGDAVIGINPASDNVKVTGDILCMLDSLIQKLKIPTQSCVLSHLTTTMELIKKGYPVDLVFQSIAGSEKANLSFGINLCMIQEAYESALELKRGSAGNNVMYFETGQGSALSANAHFGVDQQTMEARAYAVARKFNPLLVNTVVGFIGPEYLFNGKQIIRAGIEDHFCGKLLGLPMGCDVCYTIHAEADQDDMDNLLTLLATAGCNYIMGVPGADDVMLNYQSTSFHDALYIRKLLGLKPAPEFMTWLTNMNILHKDFSISGARDYSKFIDLI